ncbi:type I-F CRISPR-associated protein Csy1 [Moraxellaceae bacterium AER2_44_116]|nr:type I-F CRISPR-associated protein Csy1 [Moraxellaceae bacterium]TQC99933.1 type I-F CRISPR-associated protein Csy1 [Moraxellaceae bacterium AER2_44_116]
MENADSDAVNLRHLIHGFINERKQAKLDKLKPEQINEREELEQKYLPETWLADAARRVNQIQLATHTIKPIHPDARGTSLYVTDYPQRHGLVGSHCLKTASLADDVVGNAAALDVYKFLSLEHNSKTLLARMLQHDASINAALSENVELAQQWQQAFVGITQGNVSPTSDTLAKQLYFPLADGSYHLLAPLFPTSLVHKVHGQLREDRFSETAKASRDARRAEAYSPIGHKEYPNLVVQKFGGTKPQNISQLNSERYGENWLLPSFPPTWQSQGVQPPNHIDSVFSKYLLRRRAIRQLTKDLREFLIKKTDENNMEIRQQRAEFMARIVDEVFLFSFELLELPAGWSAASDCKLVKEEALWLDPYRRFQDEDFNKDYEWKDWPDEIAKRFGNWLNSVLATDKMPMGEAEAKEWQRDLDAELSLFRLEL